MVQPVDHRAHHLLQLLEVQQQPGRIQVLAAQGHAHLVVVPVRVLALAAIVAQIVPGRKPGLYRYLVHTNVFLCQKGQFSPSSILPVSALGGPRGAPVPHSGAPPAQTSPASRRRTPPPPRPETETTRLSSTATRCPASPAVSSSPSPASRTRSAKTATAWQPECRGSATSQLNATSSKPY